MIFTNRVYDSVASSFVRWDSSAAPDVAGATYPGPGTFGVDTEDFCIEKTVADGGVTDHGALVGLGDDDHPDNAYLPGRSGGQTLIGGTGVGDQLTLQGSSDPTSGGVFVYDSLEVSADLDVAGTFTGINATLDGTLTAERVVVVTDAGEAGSFTATEGDTTQVISLISTTANGGASPGNINVFVGARSPEGVVTADAGDLYFRASVGSSDIFVKDTGSGNTGWISFRNTGGTATPGGSTTEVQYNDAGVLSGDSDFVWDKTNNRLRVPTLDIYNSAADADEKLWRITTSDDALKLYTITDADAATEVITIARSAGTPLGVVFSTSLGISSTGADTIFAMGDTSLPVDEKYWNIRIETGSGDFLIETSDESSVPATVPALQITRIGNETEAIILRTTTATGAIVLDSYAVTLAASAAISFAGPYAQLYQSSGVVDNVLLFANGGLAADHTTWGIRQDSATSSLVIGTHEDGSLSHPASVPAITIERASLAVSAIIITADDEIELISSDVTITVTESVSVESAFGDSDPLLWISSAGTNGAQTQLFVGTRVPHGLVTADPGSLYFRTNGTSSGLFTNTSATADDVWEAVGTSAPEATPASSSGDLTIDCSRVFNKMTLSENITDWTFTNVPAAGMGRIVDLILVQGASAYTVDFTAGALAGATVIGGLPVMPSGSGDVAYIQLRFTGSSVLLVGNSST
jgi:hypothetical protein